MTNNIIQHLILTISDITGYNLSVTYAHYYDLIKDIEAKSSVIPSQLLNNIETQISSIHAIHNKDIKINSLRGWLLYFYHNPNIVENIMNDIVPDKINVYFEDENSNKTCRILSNRIVKECKRLYSNLDEFDITNLSLALSTVTYEGMIKILKNLKSIDAVKCCIPLQYLINEILLKC